MKRTAIFLLLMFVSGIIMAAELVLVKPNSVANSEIILSATAKTAEKTAATELQYWIKEITGALLPINSKVTKKQYPVKIFIGENFASKFPEDLKFLKGSDGFAIRSKGNNIYIFGTVPRGTLYGAYAFLEANTDIIWARGDEKFGTVFSTVKSLTAKKSSWREKPVFDVRGWWITYTFVHGGTTRWCARMRCNYSPTSNDYKKFLERLEQGGFQLNLFPGHNLNRFMKKKYFDEHPEYFALVDGIRQKRVSSSQVCFSNMKGADVLASEVINEVKKRKIDADSVNVKTEDNWRLCECPDCRKNITLENGKISRYEDENFRSNQFFIYLNQVMKTFHAVYPDKRVVTYAYIFTAPPPDIKVHTSVDIAFCPFVKNDKYSILDPQNKKWLDRITAWSNASKNVMWREYYGCASYFPRPLADVAVKDMRHLHGKLGLSKIYSEVCPDYDTKTKKPRKLSEAWDVSAMEFWVLSRLYWNPYQDVEELRKEYLTRAYRSAAPAMARYYKLIRDAWYSDPVGSAYNENASRSAAYYIVGKKLEAPCRSALIEAEKAAANEVPQVKELVKRQRNRFEHWMSQSANFTKPELHVPYIAQSSQAMADNDKLWEKAGLIKELQIMGAPAKKPANQTAVRAMHDRNNLYLRFDCNDAQPELLYAQTLQEGKEIFPRGDHIEIFFDGNLRGKGYYQFAVDVNGNAYDAKGFDQKYSSNWQTKVKKTVTGYTVLAAIPIKNLNLSMNNRFGALFYRCENHNTGKTVHSSWQGGAVHQQNAFGDLVLNME